MSLGLVDIYTYVSLASCSPPMVVGGILYGTHADTFIIRINTCSFPYHM